MSGSAARAQGAPSFEVASVKPHSDDAASAAITPGHFFRPDVTVGDLIQFAFDLQDVQVIGGPPWIRSTRYDVNATAAGTPSQDAMRAMVKTLLVDRFGLRFHDDTRTMPVYALERIDAAKRDAPGLVPSSNNCAAIRAARRTGQDGAPLAGPVCAGHIGIGPASAFMLLEGSTLDQLAKTLPLVLKNIVLNRTGLEGLFDLRLEFTTDGTVFSRPAIQPPAAQAATDRVSLFTAVQEQLGLKLTSTRSAVRVVVVDEAREPEPN